jgi:BirA family biotin operon repressor/biotin-[acetyl-CoA-carboxylase] ligase
MKIIWLDTIDSTNSEALRRLPSLPSSVVLAAREQTAGRGQRGNQWFSAPGQNLTFSIVLQLGRSKASDSGDGLPGSTSPDHLPALPIADTPWLNFLAAIVVADFVSGLGADCRIKWPNDIYAGWDKLCGMLIENSLSGGFVAASVIGIGLNMNQLKFPQLARATSVARLTGGHYYLDESLDLLVQQFEQALPAIFDPSQRQALFSRYTSRLFQKDVRARYHDLLTGREFDGIIRGVEPDGRLRMEDALTGAPLLYRFKEVGYIL